MYILYIYNICIIIYESTGSKVSEKTEIIYTKACFFYFLTFLNN